MNGIIDRLLTTANENLQNFKFILETEESGRKIARTQGKVAGHKEFLSLLF